MTPFALCFSLTQTWYRSDMPSSDDLFWVDVTGDTNLLRNLDRMPDVVRAICIEKITQATEKMEADVKSNIKDRLQEKSGKLLRGVESDVIEDGGAVRGRVFIAGVPYARAQEEGATTGVHMILPNKARVLAFYGREGKKVFATRVLHPGGKIPAHYFMKDAYRENGPKLAKDLKRDIVQGLRVLMRSGA